MKKSQTLATALLIAPTLALPLATASAESLPATDTTDQAIFAPASAATLAASEPLAPAEPLATAEPTATTKPTTTVAPAPSKPATPIPHETALPTAEATATPSEAPSPEPSETSAPSPTPSPEETVAPTEPEPTSAPTDSPVEPVEPETPVEPVDPEVPVEPTPTPEEPAPEEPAPAFAEEEQTLIEGDVHEFQVTGVPTADAEVKFTLTDSANVVIELRDADGELKAYIIRTADENGEVILTLDTQGLAPGEYTLTATVGDKEVTTKIIVSPSESEPTDPVDPVVPEQPIEPVEPVEPVQPVDPVVPEQPVEPVEPADPVVPTEPIQPEVPAEPAPTDPALPESPAPTEPLEPTNPANPAIENLPVTEEHQLEATDLDTAEPTNIIEALREPAATRIPDTLSSATATPQRETASREFSETLEALIPGARENSTLESREFTSKLQAGAAPGRQADAQDLQNGDTASPAPARTEQGSQDSTSSQADADTEQAASSTFDWFKALFAAPGASFIGLAAWLILGKRRKKKDEEEEV